MRHEVGHDLSLDEARQVAKQAFEHYRERYAKYDPQLTWRSDTEADASFSAKGITLRGTVELRPNAIAVELKVPFVFWIFRSRAVAIVEREVKRWCARAKAAPSD